MKKLLSLCAGMLVMITTVSPMNASAEKIALEKVPKVVIDAVKKRFPKAELEEATKETDGTKIEYEISLTDGKTNYDVMLTPEGKITLIGKVISAKDLPKVVAAALKEKYPKATYKVYEEMTKVTEGKQVLAYYEVHLETADKKILEVEISPEGKILVEEMK
jgi:hypothetical protein